MSDIAIGRFEMGPGSVEADFLINASSTSSFDFIVRSSTSAGAHAQGVSATASPIHDEMVNLHVPNAETLSAIQEALQAVGVRYFDDLNDLYRELES